MLFRAKDLEAIFAGRSTLAFRRWKKPTVKAGGTIRTALGMIGIDSIEVIDPAALTEAEARDAGYADLAGLISMFESQQGVCYRIRLHPAGADPRLALQADAALGADERQKLAGKLTRLDQASATGPWTRATLELIRDRPGVVSTALAAAAGFERAAFKLNVRKLKTLGLTISLEVGYRLSPRGEALLAGL